MEPDLLRKMIEQSAAIIAEHADELTSLDQAIGDGDHGINMKRGFDALAAAADEISALPLDQALQILNGLPAERFEYLEEPLKNPSELVDLNNRTGLPIGLDESLLDQATFYLGRAPYVAAWIIKPALIGHWQRLLFLANEAQRAEAGLVISSCVETGLGLHAQLQMAAALPGHAMDAGLATDRLLKFLKEFARRRASTGFTVLTMTRRDIADHIGLTVETVSRAFGTLKRQGLVEMRGSDRFRFVNEAVSLAA